MENGGEYEVELIFGWMVQNGHHFYGIKWQNYGWPQITWEPPQHLAAIPNLIVDFHVALQMQPPTHEIYGHGIFGDYWIALILPPNVELFVNSIFNGEESDTDEDSDSNHEQMEDGDDVVADPDYIPSSSDDEFDD